jgi:uncharacterized membrane protein HdeD (DUF308 family)
MNLIAHYWRLLMLRGFVAIVFGILAIAWPGLTVTALVLLFGVYALIDGGSSTVAAITKAPGTEERRGWFALMGVISIAAAIVTFVWPGITALALLYVIAAWAIIVGVLQVIAAVRYRNEMTREWLLALTGVLSVGVGIGMFIWPGAGALAITWVIGWFAILGGTFLFAEGLRVRRIEKQLEDLIDRPTPMHPFPA